MFQFIILHTISVQLFSVYMSCLVPHLDLLSQEKAFKSAQEATLSKKHLEGDANSAVLFSSPQCFLQDLRLLFPPALLLSRGRFQILLAERQMCEKSQRCLIQRPRGLLDSETLLGQQLYYMCAEHRCQIQLQC